MKRNACIAVNQLMAMDAFRLLPVSISMAAVPESANIAAK